MIDTCEKSEVMIGLLQSILKELQLMNTCQKEKVNGVSSHEFVHVPFKGSEIYLLHKAFVDAGGAPNDSLKSLLEKTLTAISNKTQRGFSVDSVYKCSDKVCPETKENVKRFLIRMIRNIDSYD
ncbi:MAG: hypothetical protein J7502_18755 [Flavisolibacter sp.]|nr:hypothetical protein [Flavisolibacter sp.]